MHLDNKTIANITDTLNARQQELKDNVATDLNTNRKVGSHLRGGEDSGDESNYEQRTHMALTKTNRDAYELELVELALQHIQSGEYGLCVDCGEEISSQRLVANPISKRCISCQANHEDDRDERDSTPSM